MLTPHLENEKKIWLNGGLVCGIDEVGRGCIAGPVVAGAVIFPSGHKPHSKIRDSKTLSPKQRCELFDFITGEAEDFGLGLVSAIEIDEIGIVAATQKAMIRSIKMLKKSPDLLLIDATQLKEIKISQKSIIKGDSISYSIAASSIIAKDFRDQIISGLDNIYKDYGFSSHKGYGTALHYEAIKKNGLTPEHRKTFLKKIFS